MGIRNSSFLSPIDPATFIVYGPTPDPSLVLSDALNEDVELNSLANRFAWISHEAPDLRLCSPGWFTLTFDERLEFQAPESLFLMCREKISQRASKFSVLVRQFLDLYLDFVWSQVSEYQTEISAAHASPEMFTFRDWIYSALLPLPEAKIFLPAELGTGNYEFAEIDIVFWHKGELIQYSAWSHPALNPAKIIADTINKRF